MNGLSEKRVATAAMWAFWGVLALVVWGELSRGGIGINVYDKIQHLGAYAILAGLATLATGARKGWLWALLGLVALGGALEIVQGLVGRDADIRDEIANTLGVIVGGSAGWAACVLLRAWLVESSAQD
jgi:VanZ family protein